MFATIVHKYLESKLKQCETKSNQYWRQVSGKAVKVRLQLFTEYFPELSSLIDSLENYSICEKHYNQIVAINKFYETLLNSNTDRDSDIHVIQRKRTREVNILESHTSTIDTVADRNYIGESDISEEQKT